MKKMIVSNGMVVDKNFMNLDLDGTKTAITKHRPYTVFYLFLLPVSKSNPTQFVSSEDAKKLRNDSDNVLNI